jgi:hypothetical protein
MPELLFNLVEKDNKKIIAKKKKVACACHKFKFTMIPLKKKVKIDWAELKKLFS